MRRLSLIAVILMAVALCAQALPINGCTLNATGITQTCWITEGYGFDLLSPEPPVIVSLILGVTPGYWTIYEPGSQTVVSDYLVFRPDPTVGFVLTAVLYSADANDAFPTDILSGLDQQGFSNEPFPEPCWNCVVRIDYPTGDFVDTFNIVSDPTPEPAMFLLTGSALVLLGLRRFGRR